MKWSIHQGSSTTVELFTTIGIALLGVSFFVGDGMVFFAAAIMLFLGVYPRWYLSQVSKHFAFQNETEKIHLSQGDRGELHVVLSNESKFPIVHGTVEFTLDDYVHVDSINKSANIHYHFDFSLKAKQKETFALPIVALTRGIAKMKNLKIKIHDPMRLAHLTLNYDFIRKEVVVYPQKKTVLGMERLLLPIEGYHPHQTSIFQDLTSPIGTREYIPSDPLKYVHWKASARTGTLQTKVFEKTMGMSWIIMILLDKEVTKDARMELEEQLSYAATICFEAQKRGVETEIFINTKSMGRSLVHHLEAGHDRAHFIKAMEFLALIQIQYIKTNPLEALSEMDRSFHEPHVILVIDQAKKTDKTRFYRKWQKNGHAVYLIDLDGFITSPGSGGVPIAQ